MGNLTARQVASLKEPGRYVDGGGLHLYIDRKGRRYWILRLQGGGRTRDVSLGPERRLTLAQARVAARDRREAIEAGIENQPARQQSPLTFAEAAEAVFALREGGWRNAKHRQGWQNSLKNHIYPVFGGKAVAEVSRADILAALEPIWLSRAETARRVLQRIDVVLRWAVGHGHRENLIDLRLIRDALPRQPRQIIHMKAVPWADAPAFYRALSESRSAAAVKAALRWQILTAARPGNTARLKWDDIDRAANIWTVAAEDMKMLEAHRVPLPPAALSLLDGIEATMGRHSPYVFSAPGDEKPMTPCAMRMLIRRMGRDETPHGFRSTFKDWSLAHDWPDHLSERALAHADRSRVRAAYARADLLEERRPMMEAWAAFVTGG